MAQKRQQTLASANPPAGVVLFGVDEHGKPKAARFGDTEAKLVTKVAEQMRLKVLTIASPAVAEIAEQLPAGRIHARGRGVVSHIRADLYAKLVSAAAADGANEGPLPPTPPSALPGGPPPSGNDAANRRPRNWDEIAPGHLVVAQESPEDGWYDAVVVSRTGDMCTLRWRDYSRLRPFTRHRRTLALRCPDPESVSALIKAKNADKPAKPAPKTAEAAQSLSAAEGLPTNWSDIAVGHLVLAMCDGPWQSWWEAIPTDIHDATLTLRWRDYRQLPQIERARVSLALLCPTTA